eukprot:Sspe_Gene.3059::Locus_1011_Transcript_69_72_Confidence_0.016_Length_1437::g.3059::m.3059
MAGAVFCDTFFSWSAVAVATGPCFVGFTPPFSGSLELVGGGLDDRPLGGLLPLLQRVEGISLLRYSLQLLHVPRHGLLAVALPPVVHREIPTVRAYFAFSPAAFSSSRHGLLAVALPAVVHRDPHRTRVLGVQPSSLELIKREPPPLPRLHVLYRNRARLHRRAQRTTTRGGGDTSFAFCSQPHPPRLPLLRLLEEGLHVPLSGCCTGSSACGSGSTASGQHVEGVFAQQASTPNAGCPFPCDHFFPLATFTASLSFAASRRLMRSADGSPRTSRSAAEPAGSCRSCASSRRPTAAAVPRVPLLGLDGLQHTRSVFCCTLASCSLVGLDHRALGGFLPCLRGYRTSFAT